MVLHEIWMDFKLPIETSYKNLLYRGYASLCFFIDTPTTFEALAIAMAKVTIKNVKILDFLQNIKIIRRKTPIYEELEETTKTTTEKILLLLKEYVEEIKDEKK